ncbi:hypothetical protein FACS1894188_00800 [Clostridia bacterium]|nr:hypothetical protein FACS1894188_00800 [Clostridia bacterium]
MALPIILGIAAGAAALGGVGAGIKGGIKMKEANDTMSAAKSRHDKNIARFESANVSASGAMDAVGKTELEILNGFEEFSDVWSKIHNKPEFRSLGKENVNIVEYSAEELKEVSVGAGVLLGGLGGAAVGTAGGFAAAGATTAAVMALGTASTGTAIASLSGVAATNAALAALGGGAIAAGGGGMALGTAILGASTLGIGLLVGGIVFSIAGNSVSDKADTAWAQMKDEEKIINELCVYLADLKNVADGYLVTLQNVNNRYKKWFRKLKAAIDSGKTDWNSFTQSERLNAENTVLSVGLLYEMCKVKLVIAQENDKQKNTINYADSDEVVGKAAAFLTAS